MLDLKNFRRNEKTMLEELENLVDDEGEPLLEINYPEERHLEEVNTNSNNYPEHHEFPEEEMDQPIPEMDQQEVIIYKK